MSEAESPGTSSKTDPPDAGGSSRRWGVIVFLLLIIGASAAHWSGDITRQIKLLRLQRQCLTYAGGADQVVYQAGVDVILREGSLGGRIDALVPEIWSEYLTNVQGVTRPTTSASDAEAEVHRPREALIFLHALSATSGQKRLVAITYSPTFRAMGTSSMLYHQFHPLVIEPAGWTSPPVRKSKRISQTFLSGAADPQQTLKAYAGQVDPKDPSRFSITIVVGDKELVIDGKLENDDALIMAVRRFGTPPASNRASRIGE